MKLGVNLSHLMCLSNIGGYLSKLEGGLFISGGTTGGNTELTLEVSSVVDSSDNKSCSLISNPNLSSVGNSLFFVISDEVSSNNITAGLEDFCLFDVCDSTFCT